MTLLSSIIKMGIVAFQLELYLTHSGPLQQVIIGLIKSPQFITVAIYHFFNWSFIYTRTNTINSVGFILQVLKLKLLQYCENTKSQKDIVWIKNHLLA